MPRTIIVKRIPVWVCILLLSACTFEVKVVPTPNALFPNETETPALTAAAPTPVFTTTVETVTPPAGAGLSTDESQGTRAATSVVKASSRVQMEAGATSATLAGRVEPGGRVDYLVWAQAGQFMISMFESASSDLHLEILAPDGKWLASNANPQTFWQGTLPANGDYHLSIVSNGGAASYSLSITIPVRVKFAPGTVSDSLTGQIGANQVNTYLLRASQGQTMTVVIDAPSKDIFLTIYGLEDGQPLIRSAMGSTQASVNLPATQDYVINLVSTGNQAERYQVTFTVR